MVLGRSVSLAAVGPYRATEKTVGGQTLARRLSGSSTKLFGDKLAHIFKHPLDFRLRRILHVSMNRAITGLHPTLDVITFRFRVDVGFGSQGDNQLADFARLLVSR